MSTNSNEVDDLMQDGPVRQTKLQKFLRTLDQETMKHVNKYLLQNENPSNENNNKSEKIKLYQDLLIIYTFKKSESQITNKKKIDQLCNKLKEKLQYSVFTIRQRIQKKLTNVSKEQILNHIQLGLDFTFNTKRKLIPSKMKKKPKDEKDLGLEDSSRIQARAISVHSGGQDSPDSVQQIPRRPQIKKPQKQSVVQSVIQQNSVSNSNASLQAPPPNPKPIKKKSSNQKTKFQQYNQFRNASDHQGDNQMFVKKEIIKNKQGKYIQKFIFNSLAGQECDKSILNMMQQEIRVQRSEITNKITVFYGQYQMRPQSEEKSNQQILPNEANRIKKLNDKRNITKNNTKNNQNQNKNINNNNNNSNSNQKSNGNNNSITSNKYNNNNNNTKPPTKQHSNNKNNEQIFESESQDKQFALPIQNEQQLKYYCSVQDLKKATQNKQQFECLKWFPDQDQFLKQIVKFYNEHLSNNEMADSNQFTQVRNKLIILKKFKNPGNIVARIKFLGLNPTDSLMVDLLGTYPLT